MSKNYKIKKDVLNNLYNIYTRKYNSEYFIGCKSSLKEAKEAVEDLEMFEDFKTIEDYDDE